MIYIVEKMDTDPGDFPYIAFEDLSDAKKYVWNYFFDWFHGWCSENDLRDEKMVKNVCEMLSNLTADLPFIDDVIYIVEAPLNKREKDFGF